MATTFFFRNATIGQASYPRYLSPSRGGSSNTITLATNGSDQIMGSWCSDPVVGFTLAGTVDINIWATEANGTTNCGIRIIVKRLSKTGVLSAAIATITTSELPTAASPAVRTASAASSSTAILDGEQLVFEVWQTAAGGGMASGRAIVFSQNGPTAATTGDTYVTLAETISLRNRARLTG